MKTSVKLVFTGISALLIVAGVLAIATRHHTSSSRFHGIVTMLGDDAVWSGRTSLLLAVLPLLVWLPERWFGMAVALWWVALMVWLFAPFVLR